MKKKLVQNAKRFGRHFSQHQAAAATVILDRMQLVLLQDFPFLSLISFSTISLLVSARLERIQQEFAARFNNGVRPTLLVRSPGRVNLIGKQSSFLFLL